MLKKIIALTSCLALLASTGMIASAQEYSNAETSVISEAEQVFDSKETTVDLTETTEETTTTTVEPTPKDVGAAIRLGLDVKVQDCVAFYNVTKVYDAEGNVYYVDVGRQISIVGIDDVNQRFRVLAPDAIPQSDSVKYLLYADTSKGLDILSHEGPVVGDLDFDGRVDVFDMCLMRRGYIYGWNRNIQEKMADMNADGEVSIADLIWLQKWLLGVIK